VAWIGVTYLREGAPQTRAGSDSRQSRS